MTWEKPASPSMTERGMRIALIFALAAERLTAFYEYGQWLTEAQGASLASDWLSRSKNKMPLAERRQLSALSDQLARQIQGIVDICSQPATTLVNNRHFSGFVRGVDIMLTLDENERRHIRRVLSATGYKLYGKGGAAEVLGLPPSTLQSRMK